mgnify:CR=1 FL=1
MGSLISYSGISTKVKAMERFRIRPEQFEAMADLGSVPEAVQFLRSNPSYEKAFSKASEDELHRGKIEQLLNLSKYHDFAKLYRFANVGQRRFLDLYFMQKPVSEMQRETEKVPRIFRGLRNFLINIRIWIWCSCPSAGA